LTVDIASGNVMLAHALLLRPSGRRTDSRLFATEQLGLSYIASVARSHGLSVRIIDGFLEPERYEQLLSEIKTGDYFVIGYPIYQETLRRVAKDVDKLRARGVSTHVTVGNHLATFCAEEILTEFKQFDSAIRGEGEETFSELVQSITSDLNIEQILGLTSRIANRIVAAPPRPNSVSLDDFPFPARDTLALVMERGNAPLIYGSRGCYAKCSFCSVHEFFRASPNGMWRGRSASNIVDEIEYLHTEFGATEFAFADEQFMGFGEEGRLRALALASEILHRNLKVKWYIETRSSDVSYEIFKILREAGLRAVFMGIESGYEPTLVKSFKKGIRTSQHLQAVEILKRLELLASVGFIMFQPKSSFQEIRTNLDFLEAIECAEVTTLTTKLRVYAGTIIQRQLQMSGKLSGTYYNYDWEFEEPIVGDLFSIVLESADTLSTSYNEFARIRRSGILTYSECLSLQRAMNVKPFEIVRDTIRALEGSPNEREEIRIDARKRFIEACDSYIRLVKFVETIAKKRTQSGKETRMAAPMSLC
jgi:anaerobic magnesium-protoporphyrin IX monomethyl ester cyclase